MSQNNFFVNIKSFIIILKQNYKKLKKENTKSDGKADKNMKNKIKVDFCFKIFYIIYFM